MGKKRLRSKYTSKGERRSVSASTLRMMREEYRTPSVRMMNQLEALMKGKDVVVTIENPDKNQTNKRFIKKRISGKEFLNRRQSKLATHNYGVFA